MQGHIISTPVDVVDVAHRVIGFIPSESLVLLGIGTRRFAARVDLNQVRSAREAAKLSAALTENRIEAFFAVVYTDSPDDAERMRHILFDTRAFDNLDLIEALQVTGRRVYGLGTEEPFGEYMTDPLLVDGHPVLASRDVIVTEAQQVADPARAAGEAVAAYIRGDGARAWVFIDRAIELGVDDADVDQVISLLRVLLLEAVNPATMPGVARELFDKFVAATTPAHQP